MVLSKYLFKRVNKKLRLGYISSAGRNFLGTICVHHRSGGTKKKSYLLIILDELIHLVMLLKF
jgi:hypothetical protein